MLDTADGSTFHSRPIDGRVERFVDKAYNTHVVAAHDVEAQRNFHGWLLVLRLTDNTLDASLEDLGTRRVTRLVGDHDLGGGRDRGERQERWAHQVGLIVGTAEVSHEGTSICRNDGHFLCC